MYRLLSFHCYQGRLSTQGGEISVWFWNRGKWHLELLLAPTSSPSMYLRCESSEYGSTERGILGLMKRFFVVQRFSRGWDVTLRMGSISLSWTMIRYPSS